MSTSPANLVDIVQQLEDTSGAEKITIDEMLDKIGQASFAPVLIIPAVALATPLSGIPLFSSAMGIIIFLVSAQMLLRRDHLWFPNWILRLETKRARVQNAFQKIHPVLAWLDRRTQRRLSIFTHRPLVFIPQLICVVSGLVLPLLEFVPFSSSLVGVAVALLGIGMFARDGVIITLAVLPYVAIGWLVMRIV